MKESEVAKLIALLKVHADHSANTAEIVSMWAMAMDDVPYPAAMAAYRHWVKTRKWFPKPVEFRQVIEEQVCGLPSVDDAWSQIERSMRMNYPGQPVKYTPDRLVIEAARTIGGTHALRNAESGYEFDKLRERFRQVYAEMRNEAAQTVDIAQEWTRLGDGAQDGTPALAGKNGARS